MKLLHVSLLLPLLMACQTLTEPEAPDLLPTPPDQAGPVVITGRVVNSVLGVQGGAHVRVLEARVSGGTDETGRYRIELPARFRGRAVPVQVLRIGFKPKTRTVMVTGDTVTVDFSIDAAMMEFSCTMGILDTQAYTARQAGRK